MRPYASRRTRSTPADHEDACQRTPQRMSKPIHGENAPGKPFPGPLRICVADPVGQKSPHVEGYGVRERLDD